MVGLVNVPSCTHVETENVINMLYLDIDSFFIAVGCMLDM